MKTNSIILFLFAMLLLCGHTRAQDDLPYRPFKAFNKDTIRYLDYNFTIRNDQYVDKTIGDLFHDLELPVVFISNIAIQMDPTENKIVCSLIALNLVIRMARDVAGDDSKDYYIKIALKTPIDFDKFSDAVGNDRERGWQTGFYYWTTQLYNLLKDSEIKGLESNYHLFKDRENLLEINTVESRKQLMKIVETEKTHWRDKIRAEKASGKEIIQQ